MSSQISSIGISDVEKIVGGVHKSDSIVWELNSGVTVDHFSDNFAAAAASAEDELIYVSFNRSPQTISEHYRAIIAPEHFCLVDSFSSGKGDGDDIFVEFFSTELGKKVVHVKKPSDPQELITILSKLGKSGGKSQRYIFDSLTGMFDLWGDEEKVLRFFGHVCPRLHDLGATAMWMLENDAHTAQFLAKVRHIAQVVLKVSVEHGVSYITVHKSAGRKSADIGIPQLFRIQNGVLHVETESRASRELGLLEALAKALSSALEPESFFEQTLTILEQELGMVRGSLYLVDSADNRLRIKSAHGLSSEERARGEYKIGEGISGSVVKTGKPEIIADIAQDARFLNRTATHRERVTAFICVPIFIDQKVVGALSVDRPNAHPSMLDLDLRLLTIVASTIAQVLKINRIMHVEKDELISRDEKALRELRERYKLESVAGHSKPMRKLLATAATAARSNATVLITGETGTGKELVANVVHFNSLRREGPLVKVNCGALPETLLESELFGHVRGAFTGAVKDRKGRFELASGGTLLLDEVAEMSPRLQVKLLRALQEREFEPVGSTRTIKVDVRLLAATNRDLKQAITDGEFREDLYYRLNVIPIHLPPLRERREDIPILVDHFLEEFNAANERNVTKLSRDVLDMLMAHSWPGNVRELENLIERAVVMSPGDVFTSDILPEEITGRKIPSGSSKSKSPRAEWSLKREIELRCKKDSELKQVRENLLDEVEAIIIKRGLGSGKSQRELATILGMSRMTLRKKMRRMDIQK